MEASELSVFFRKYVTILPHVHAHIVFVGATLVVALVATQDALAAIHDI